MDTVTLWSASPGGASQEAIKSAVRIANRSLSACGLKIGIAEARVPEADPQPVLIKGLTTSASYCAAIILGSDTGDLEPTCQGLVDRVHSMARQGRTVSVTTLVDSAIATSAHMDLVHRLTRQGLPPWEVQRFKNTLHLQELLSINLVVQAATFRRGQSVELST